MRYKFFDVTQPCERCKARANHIWISVSNIRLCQDCAELLGRKKLKRPETSKQEFRFFDETGSQM